MPISAPAITDQDILQKIQFSGLPDQQKTELQKLLPDMTQIERQELSELIDESLKALIAADPALQKKVADLNSEYDRKLNDLVHHEYKSIRESFEHLDQEGVATELSSLETEMVTAADNPSAADSPLPLRRAVKGRAFRRMFIVLPLVLLVGIAAVVIAYVSLV